MKKYTVTFVKYETYEVKAENPDKAEDKAFYKLENDSWAWMNLVDEIRVEECE